MVSDPVSAYDHARVDVLRKVGPPMSLRPGNVVSLAPDPEFQVLHARKFGEAWTVAARFGWGAKDAAEVDLGRLGLNPESSYLAYDFWEQKFLGIVTGKASFHALADGACQVVSFRPLQKARPQILGTDRHIGQGVVEIDSARWKDGVLSGQIRSVAGHPWKLWIYVPEGWTPVSVAGGTSKQEGQLLELALSEGPSPASWSVGFRKARTVSGNP
jgi:hypothetical protein